MPHVDFTLDDLDQSVLDALERKRQRRETQVLADGAIVEGTLQERLQEAMQRRMGKPIGNGKAPAK